MMAMRPRSLSFFFLFVACLLCLHSSVWSLRHEGSDAVQSFLRKEAGPDRPFFIQAADRKTLTIGEKAWVCRTSKMWGGCGSREFVSGGRSWQDASCPKNACCSKIACSSGQGCGSFCTEGFFLCPVKFLYHPEYSYGSCSCSAQGGECDKNAVCVDVPGPEGGAFCHCKHGFVGDGKACRPGGCDLESNNCSPGSCVPLGGSNYTCNCPADYKLSKREGRPFCVRKPCSGNACGTGKCFVTKDGGHDCRCSRGSVKAFDGNQPTCVSGENVSAVTR